MSTASIATSQQSRYLKGVRQLLEQNSVPEAGCGMGRLRWLALEKAERLGLPTRKAEPWKFIDLTPLLQASQQWGSKPISTAEAADTLSHEQLSGCFLYPAERQPLRLIFVNGTFNSALSGWSPEQTQPATGLTIALLSQNENLQPDLQQRLQMGLNRSFEGADNGLESAAHAMTQKGLFIHVAKDCQIERPIELILIHSAAANANVASVSRLILDLEQHSKLQLSVRQLDLDGAHSSRYTHLLTQITLAEQASLSQTQLWQAQPGALCFSKLQASLATEARYSLVQVAQGGTLQRHEANVALEGTRADAQLRGLALLNGSTAFHQHVKVEHLAEDTTSSQLFKSIVDAMAKAEFEGRIFVDNAAQKTDAQQLSRALLLSPKAKAFARPWLVIDADDVKCSHGATVGQLSKEELFYLASRGLNAELASCLLTYGFASDVLTYQEDPDLREALVAVVLAALGLSQKPSTCFTTCLNPC